jgi:diaminopimelate epimerase
MGMLTLVKYQGLGNDFLVSLDGSEFDAAAAEYAAGPRHGSAELGRSGLSRQVAEFVGSICARHSGAGADGLLVVRPAVSGGQVRMELYNADGSRAEISGNGLRCFALALADAGVVQGPEVLIATDAGIRRALLERCDGPGRAEVRVEMGQVMVAELDALHDVLLPGSMQQGCPSWSVDVGNPHLVVLAPCLEDVALASLGPRLEKARPGGQNVEVVACGPGPGELSLVVWERGAGLTLACGSGSVAAAAALHSAGICFADVEVHNPGGTARVILSGDDPHAPRAELSGPARRVVRVLVEPGELTSPIALEAQR